MTARHFGEEKFAGRGSWELCATPSIHQNSRTYPAGFPLLRFEDSREMAIRWYLDNQAWWDAISSGAYRQVPHRSG